MGPSASAGKKVRPPTIRITPTTQADEQAAIGWEGAGRRRDRLLGRERAGNGHGRDDHEEAADEHRDGAGRVVEGRVAGDAAERRAVIAGARGEEIENLGEAVRPWIGDRGHRRRHHRGDGRPAQIHERQDEDGEHGHLHFLGLDFLADIFRGAADHQSGDEHRDDHEQQHAVHAGADTADDDLAELDVDQRDHAAKRGEGIMHGVDGAAGGRGGDHREQGGQRQCRSALPCLPYWLDRARAPSSSDCPRPRPSSRRRRRR